MSASRRSRARAILASVLAVASMAALSVTATPQTASAAERGRFYNISLIGDSYTAGNGAGSYYVPAAYRSSRNWGHEYAQWLNNQGIRTVVHNYAASGAVTQDMINTQVPQLDPTSDMVMLTAGGNDVGFSKIVTYCYAAVIVSKGDCKWAINNANEKLEATRANTDRLLTAIAGKLKPGAKITLVGYPLLNVSYGDWTWDPDTPFEYNATAKVRELGTKATAMQAEVVEKWNAANGYRGVKVTYVPTQDFFDTADGREHSVDPRWGKDNPYRWINGLQESEGKADPVTGVVTDVHTPFDRMNWYHPNITGHAKIAQLLAEKIGVPSNVRGAAEVRKNVDVFFLVDDSKATAAQLAAMKTQMAGLVDQYQKDAYSWGKQARFGLIVYHNGWGPYRWATKQNLTAGAPTILSKINALKTDTYYTAGDAQLYDALNDTLKSAYETRGWNPANRQVLYVFGPATVSGYRDWDEPARRAFANSSTEINIVDTDATVNNDLRSLAVRTGGTYSRVA